MPVLPTIASPSSATQSSVSSRTFQMSAIRPPGRSTRAISCSAGPWSNQWNACATVTTSALAVLERDRLRPALDRGHAGNAGTEVSDHLGERLDRGDPVPESREGARQLARPGAEVDDVEWLGDIERLCDRGRADEPAHRVIGIAGAGTLVGVGDRSERARARLACIAPHGRILRRSLRLGQRADPEHGRGQQPQDAGERAGGRDPERRPKADRGPEPPAGQRAEHADAVVHEHVRTGDPGPKLGRDHRGEDRARTDVQQHHPETRAELGEEEQGEDRALRSRCERDEQERCGEDHAADREARPEADRPGDPTGDDGADETAHRTGAEDEPERARSDAELARRVEHEEREEDEVEEVDRRGREQGRPHERRADHEANAAADAASFLVGAAPPAARSARAAPPSRGT